MKESQDSFSAIKMKITFTYLQQAYQAKARPFTLLKECAACRKKESAP